MRRDNWSHDKDRGAVRFGPQQGRASDDQNPELQAKIKIGSGKGNNSNPNELNEARDEFRVERSTKAQASAKADREAKRIAKAIEAKAKSGSSHSQRVTIKGTSVRALNGRRPYQCLERYQCLGVTIRDWAKAYNR